MRVALIADTSHYRGKDGTIHAVAPVAAQLDRWAALFDELVLCTPLTDGNPPSSWAPYHATNLAVHPLPSGGGRTLLEKLALLPLVPVWLARIRQVIRAADAIHLRAPCNIAAVGMVACLFTRKPRYAVYAGVWHGYRGEPFSYRFQRWWLRQRWFRGPVTIYAAGDDLAPHLIPFFSPSFTQDDWERDAAPARAKILAVADPTLGGPLRPLRLVTIGLLTENKNQACAIRALARLHEQGVHAVLDVVGEGANRSVLGELVRALDIADHVNFTGDCPHPRVWELLRRADVNLLATRQEGFGKVLLEGMVTATVPVCSQTGVTAEIVGYGERGVNFPVDDDEALAAAIIRLLGDRSRWQAMLRAGREFTKHRTLEAFQSELAILLERHWRVSRSEFRRATRQPPVETTQANA